MVEKLTREQVQEMLRKAKIPWELVNRKDVEWLAQDWLEMEQEIARLREASPDPKELAAVADWLDARYPHATKPEVHQALRAWAAIARVLLEERKL